VRSLPGALRQAYQQGGLDVFSRAFLEDSPKRLTGPGRFRFIPQHLIATILSVRSGAVDARTRRPPYLMRLVRDGPHRGELVRECFQNVIYLLLMGILLDAIVQWVMLGVSHAGRGADGGAGGIVTPYVLARSLANGSAGSRGLGSPAGGE
jgi:hypothetical protein